MLESEYRLCRDFQRGKQLSANSLRGCVHLASWSNRYAPQTLKHVRRTMYRS